VYFNASINSNILPSANDFDLGSNTNRWKTLYSTQATFDDILINTNFISTTQSNSNLEFGATGTGVIRIDALDISSNTISSTATNADININPNGTGKIQLLKDTDITGNLGVTGNITLGGSIHLGDVTIDSIDPVGKIGSNLTVTGSIFGNSSAYANNPSYTFSTDPSTGMYLSSFNNLSFSTGGQERMRLTSSELIVSNAINGLTINNGTCTGIDFIATSDQRTKTNIATISNALDIVNGLRGVYFTRIGQTKQTVGVIAQEVEAVLPEVVHMDSEGLKSVSYGNMVGVLIEAVKTLSERLKKIESA
jgi:hypothetical protein